MRQLLAGLDSHAATIVAAEVRGPLTRPAQSHDDSLVFLIEVEVAESIVGRAPARCSNMLFNLGSQPELVGLEVYGLRRASSKVVEREFATRTSLKPGIDGLNVLEDGRVGGTGVLVENSPLNYRKIVVFHSRPAHDQTGCWIFVGGGRLGAV